MTSEPLNTPDAKEQWRNFEIMRPGSREPAQLLTLGNTADNSIFGFAAKRTFGDFAVYNLYNSTEGTKPLTLDFKAAGLPAGVPCAVFDFWSNEVIATAMDTYTTSPLEQHSSALLRFTPLDSNRPILVGSNLHLSIGATEIDNVRVTPTAASVDLSDAGAQQGALTFYSQQPLAGAGSANCKIVSVVDLGDNLWQVNVTGRQWGTTQSIKLSVRQ